MAESDWSIGKEFNKADIRDKSRPILLALAAARRALTHSNLPTGDLSALDRCGETDNLAICTVMAVAVVVVSVNSS